MALRMRHFVTPYANGCLLAKSCSDPCDTGHFVAPRTVTPNQREVFLNRALLAGLNEGAYSKLCSGSRRFLKDTTDSATGLSASA